jgi:deoxyribonuclease V
VTYGIVDVHYDDADGARGALAVYSDDTFATLAGERVRAVAGIAPYRPGAFFARELPVLRAVLAGVPLSMIVVDSYVDLDPAGRPGLGRHVHDAFGVPVVGIAKTGFHTATHAVAVRRGSATKPVYVTSAGIDRDDAAALVAAMAGDHRLPTAVRHVDRLARGTLDVTRDIGS